MADVGSSSEPKDLIRLRITTEIDRLRFSISSQMLEKRETENRVQKIEENIKASKKALEEEEKNLVAFDNAEEGGS